MNEQENQNTRIHVSNNKSNLPAFRSIPPIRWYQTHPRYWPGGDEPEPKLQWFNGAEWVDVPKIYGD